MAGSMTTFRGQTEEKATISWEKNDFLERHDIFILFLYGIIEW